MARSPHRPQLAQDSGQSSGRVSNGGQSGLTSRDVSLLLVLTHKVRCIDENLAASVWWKVPDHSSMSARRRLRQLARSGWLVSALMFAHALPRVDGPLAVWEQGQSTPDFGPIAYHLKNRFSEPAKASLIFWASEKASKHFGIGTTRRPRVSEVSHDLGLTAVFLKQLREFPARANAWISEAKIAGKGRGQKVPDALLNDQGQGLVAIEFGGEYSKAKLREFHRHCECHYKGYELW